MRITRFCDGFIYCCLILFIFTVPLSIAVSESVFVLALIGWVVKSCSGSSSFPGRSKWKRTELDIPILVFVVVAFLSCFWGINFRSSLIGFRTYGLILILYVFLNNVYGELQERRLLFSFFAGATIFSVYTTVDRLLLKRASNPDFGWDPVILAGSMSEAGQLLVFIGITVAFLLYRRGIRERVLLILCLVPMVFAEILNFKRGSWIALIFLLLVQGWFKSRKLLAGFVCGVVIILFACSPVRERFLSLKNEFSTQRGGRLAMWQTVPEITLKHPMGVGVDNVGYVMYKINSSIEKGRDHLHSSYLQILAEMGPLGFFAFCWWMGAFLRLSYRNFRFSGEKDSCEKALSLGIFSVFIGFLLNGIVEFNFGDSEVVMLIYFLMGFSLLMKAHSHENSYS